MTDTTRFARGPSSHWLYRRSHPQTITKEVEELLGFSLQQKFIENLEPYVKKEKIYFVSGENDAISKEVLSEFQGGIHCMSAEIPRIN